MIYKIKFFALLTSVFLFIGFTSIAYGTETLIVVRNLATFLTSLICSFFIIIFAVKIAEGGL